MQYRDVVMLQCSTKRISGIVVLWPLPLSHVTGKRVGLFHTFPCFLFFFGVAVCEAWVACVVVTTKPYLWFENALMHLDV